MSSTQKPLPSDRQITFEQLLVWLVFLGQVGLLVPEVNEPNYLAKAKFFWDPGWCPNDFFLQTADGHNFFFWTFGWLTRVYSLPAVAIIGRLMICGFMAVAWQRLVTAVAPGRWLSVVSAALFAFLTYRFHMAGEWCLGGVESKGFAYAAVFAALAAVARNRWNVGWLLLGLATALHALVGGWAMVAAACGWCLLSSDAERPTLRGMLPAVVAAVLIGLPSVWSGMRLTSGVDPQVAAEACRIQVFQRLHHHLNPQQFFWYANWWGIPFGVRFGLLALAWYLVQRKLSEPPMRRLSAVVVGSLAIAVVGLIIAAVFWNDQQTAARWLRFYWFRLADVMLPAGAAIAVVATVATQRERHPAYSGMVMAAALLIGIGHMGYVSSRHLAYEIPPADRKFVKSKEKYEHWRQACEFSRNELPVDAVFIVPVKAHSFKWYSDRAEVGVWKEMPQDARSIMAWWRRLNDIYGGADGWRDSLAEAGPEHLLAMAQRYNAQYVLTESKPPLRLPKRFENDSFAIYRVAPYPDKQQDDRRLERN